MTSDSPGREPLEPGPGAVEDAYGLTPMQEGLLYQSLRDAGAYDQQITFVVEGALDDGAFRWAWEQVVARHPALRTAFHWEGLAAPVQTVHRAAPPRCRAEDWTGPSVEDQAARLADHLARELASGFVLDRPSLLRVSWFRLSPGRTRVVWTFHHLVLDGWSESVVLAEVLRLHEARRTGRPDALDALDAPPAFRAYLEWQAGQDRRVAERHWRTLLAGARVPTPLDVDRRGSEEPELVEEEAHDDGHDRGAHAPPTQPRHHRC